MNESNKTCKVCQELKSASEFHKNGSRGRHNICANCRNIKRKTWSKSWQNRPNRIFKNYKRSAEKRGLDFKLSETDFTTNKTLICEYCGSLLDKPRFDRVDNQNGYCKENIVPCCTLCNFLKNDLHKDLFLEQISKIYEYQKGK